MSVQSSSTSFNLHQTFGGVDPLLNNTYKDDNGNVIYTVHTPWSLPGTGKITTIKRSRTLLSGSGSSPSSSNPSQNTNGVDYYSNSTITQTPSTNTDGGRTSVDLDDVSPSAIENSVSQDEGIPPDQDARAEINSVETEGTEIVGQIEWKLFKSSTIRLGPNDGVGSVEADKYFTKESWGWWGRPRTFTGKDGKKYRWVLGFYAPELTLAENPNEAVVVARFHRRKLALWNTPPGYLEILPAGQHMLDEILVTFLFIERLRRDKEKEATRRAF